MLDHGGQCGHYKRILPSIGVLCVWAVVETTAMASAASIFKQDDLNFFDNIEAAVNWLGGGVDLLWSSGTLQYVPNPMEELDRLIQLDSLVLTYSRMVFSNDNSSISRMQKSRLKDNGPGPLPSGFEDCEIQYLENLISKNEFIQKNIIQNTLISEFSESNSFLFVKN